jgi:putative phosphoribosyl transferase
MNSIEHHALRIATHEATLEADLRLTGAARGIVLFAHGSGSSRFSPRNREVAQQLNAARLATLLVDLLTADEAAIDERTRQLRFDIGLLADRLVDLTDWLGAEERTAGLNVGYFGASTGAGASLAAAARRPDTVRAVVSRGGRPDLAGPALAQVRAPTLLIVGGNDGAVIDLNRQALAMLRSEKQLAIVPGATHLFAEAGGLDTVSSLAGEWLLRHLGEALGRTT